MPKNKPKDAINQKLNEIIELLSHLLAVQLYKSNVSMGAIGKHLHIAKATVVKMLKDIKKEK